MFLALAEPAAIEPCLPDGYGEGHQENCSFYSASHSVRKYHNFLKILFLEEFHITAKLSKSTGVSHITPAPTHA